MAHSVFTIVAGIIPKRLVQLDTALTAIRANLACFQQFDKLHFASFVIFDRDTDEPFLVFENSIDGSVDEYLDKVIAEPMIDAVYADNCEGYPSGASPNARFTYLKAHVRKPHVYHVGTAYRSVESIKSDLDLRRDLDLDLDQLMNAARGATGATPKPSALWQQLKSRRPQPPGREPWLLEALKNGAVLLSLAVVAALLNGLLWKTPRYLAGLLAVVFALKALWLLVLVGWPLNGHIKRAWLIPAAGGIGAVIGLWPRFPQLSFLVALLLLGFQGATWIARKLSAGEIRQSRWTSRIVPMALLASASSGLVVGMAYWVARWIGVGRLVHLEISGIVIVAILALVVGFVPAFVGLVFVSANPRRIPRFWRDRQRLFTVLGGGGALFFGLTSFCLTSDPSWWARLPAAFVLALISLGLLLGLWDVPLPAPIVDVIPASRDKLNELKAQEDSGVQNHMAVLVRIRSDHGSRSFLLKLFLKLLNIAFYRTVLPVFWKSTLFGIPTVHFAQWTVLDKKRHMFLSNYDGGWSVYLNDFGVGLNTGLQKIWGQSEGTPGVTDLGKFKEFVRTKMVPHQVWYRAYPGLTSQQIASNEKLRRGLLKPQTDAKAAELLRRLSHIEPE